MPISEAVFDDERELQDWAVKNASDFLGECVQLNGFLITTPSGKGGVPDGFAFNFDQSEWYLIECELLNHGVWPHIAEQITRFAVALKNPRTLRNIRDKLFEYVISNDLGTTVSGQLGVGVERLLQKIELFIEGVEPSLVIFIDDTNQDLNDFANALNIPTQVFRIKKLVVNGAADCYSPDRRAPVLATEPVQGGKIGNREYEVMEKLGGGTLFVHERAFKCYKLSDGGVVYFKRSKFHEKQQYYWYGITPSSFQRAKEVGVSHVIFVLGDEAFAVVPIGIVEEFLKHTNVTKFPDGAIRHYHVLISPEPDCEMYYSAEIPSFHLEEYLQHFD
jgi:hypothetical protein